MTAKKGAVLLLVLILAACVSLRAGDGDTGSILFDSNRSGTDEIFVIEADRSNLRQLTHVSRKGVTSRVPAWSPDGSSIVFASNRSGLLADLYIMDSNGRNLRQLTATPVISESNPAWSPDGPHIIYSAQTYRSATAGRASPVDSAAHIWIIKVDGSDARPLTRGSSRNIRPAWSPYGTAILFSSDRHAAPNPHFFGRDDGDLEIYRMDLNGSNVRRLTNHAGTALGAKWSPDGQQIAFHRFVAGGASDILVMNADGSEPRNLMRGRFSAGRPTWSPDGSEIAFNAEGGIYVMRADGSDPKLLTRNGRHPDWR